MNVIGEELRSIGISVTALADALEVSRPTLYGWLSGNHEAPMRFYVALELIGGKELATTHRLRVLDREKQLGRQELVGAGE